MSQNTSRSGNRSHKHAIWFPTGKEPSTRNICYQKDARLRRKNRQPLYMTLLDWEKAFDEIDHKCLGEELERLGIDKDVIETLSDGYTKAKVFRRRGPR